MLVYSRDKFLVINVRRIIYNHFNLCLCPLEINTVSIIFYKSSMLIVVLCLCQQFHIVPYCSTYHPWSSHFKFVFSRVKYRVFIVRHLIYDYHCLCVSSRVTYLVVIVWHIHPWPSFYMFVCSRVQYSVLIVRYFICEHRCFCSCHPVINTVPLTFDISSIIIVVYVRVLQR